MSFSSSTHTIIGHKINQRSPSQNSTADDQTSPPNETNLNEENRTEDGNERSDMSSKMKNPYYNPPGNSPKSLDLYITAIKSSIQKLFTSKKVVKDNLTDGERIALDDLLPE